MTFRPLLIAAAFVVLTSPAAFAHVDGHEADEQKLIPTTCAQLADTQSFSNDVSYPEIKALKTRCDSEKKSGQTPQKTPAGKTN